MPSPPLPGGRASDGRQPTLESDTLPLHSRGGDSRRPTFEAEKLPLQPVHDALDDLETKSASLPATPRSLESETKSWPDQALERRRSPSLCSDIDDPGLADRDLERSIDGLCSLARFQWLSSFGEHLEAPALSEADDRQSRASNDLSAELGDGAGTVASRFPFVARRSSFGEHDLTECPSAQDILFDGVDHNRIRACCIWGVMRGFGHVLRQDSEEITADTYERMSKPAKNIDSFLSHSWRQPRQEKLLELMLVYNLSAAAVAALLGSLLGFLLHWSGGLPLISKVTGQEGWACKALGMALYFPAFFFWGELRGLCFRRGSGPTVFFDKYCINQAYLQEKLEGIKALGATMLQSRRLIVLHSRTYFTRLWTVYEVACFMSVHSANRFLLVPEFTPKAFAIVGPAVQSAVYLLLALVNHKTVLQYGGFENVLMYSKLFSMGILLLSAAVWAPFCFVATRLWHKELDLLRQTLRTFRIQDADCFAESDREVVYRLVAQLERSVGHISADASDEEALRSFNMRVQLLLAPAVQRKFGRAGVQYSLVAVCCMLGAIDRLDSVSASLCMEAPARLIAVKMLSCVEWGLLTGPLNIACVSMIARCGVHLRGTSERVTVVVGSLASIFVSVMLQIPTLKLRAAAEIPGMTAEMALWLAWMGAEAAAIWTLFWSIRAPVLSGSGSSSSLVAPPSEHVRSAVTIWPFAASRSPSAQQSDLVPTVTSASGHSRRSGRKLSWPPHLGALPFVASIRPSAQQSDLVPTMTSGSGHSRRSGRKLSWPPHPCALSDWMPTSTSGSGVSRKSSWPFGFWPFVSRSLSEQPMVMDRVPSATVGASQKPEADVAPSPKKGMGACVLVD